MFYLRGVVGRRLIGDLDHCDAGQYCAQLSTGAKVCCVEGEPCDDVVSTIGTVTAGFLTVSKIQSSGESATTAAAETTSSSSQTAPHESTVSSSTQPPTSVSAGSPSSTRNVVCTTVPASTPNEEICPLSCGPSFQFCGYYFTCFDPTAGQTCCPNSGKYSFTSSSDITDNPLKLSATPEPTVYLMIRIM